MVSNTPTPLGTAEVASGEPLAGHADRTSTGTPEWAGVVDATGALDAVESIVEERAPGASVVITTFRCVRSAAQVALVGEFNGWSTDATPMHRIGEAFEIEVPLEPGRSYRYKFLVDGHRWENDETADDYVENEYGGHDSVRHV